MNKLPQGLLQYARELKRNNNWGIKKTRDERLWAYIIWLRIKDLVAYEAYVNKYHKRHK